MLDAVACAHLEYDYLVVMEMLSTFNLNLAKQVKDNQPQHWCMCKFPQMCWEKLTNNLAKFFNSWLRRERHHNISVFFIEHIDKVGSLLNGHHRGIHKWKGFFSPKVSMKIMANIAKGETYPTHVYIGDFIKVLIGLFSLPMRFKHVG